MYDSSFQLLSLFIFNNYLILIVTTTLFNIFFINLYFSSKQNKQLKNALHL